MGTFSDTFLKSSGTGQNTNNNQQQNTTFAKQFGLQIDYSKFQPQQQVQQPIQQPVVQQPQQEQNVFQKAGSAIGGAFNNVKNSLTSFGNNVMEKGITGVIADAIIPEDKRQSPEVIAQNEKNYLTQITPADELQYKVMDATTSTIFQRLNDMSASGAAIDALMFGTENLDPYSLKQLKDANYLDENGQVKKGKLGIEMTKTLMDISIFFPEVFVPLNAVTKVATGGKAIPFVTSLTGKAIPLAEVVDGAVIAGTYNTLYTPNLEKIFSDPRVRSEAGKNFATGAGWGTVFSIPLAYIRSPKIIKTKKLSESELAELKKLYGTLSKKYHPDSFYMPNSEAFKTIYAQYEKGNIEWLKKLNKANPSEAEKLLNIKFDPIVKDRAVKLLGDGTKAEVVATKPVVEKTVKLEVYRGEGNKIQNTLKDKGAGAMFGEGKYYADSEKYASKYGKVTKEVLELKPNEILKLDTDAKLDAYVKKAMQEFPNEEGSKAISKLATKEGYKAIVGFDTVNVLDVPATPKTPVKTDVVTPKAEELVTGKEAVTLYRGINSDRLPSGVEYEKGITFYTTDKATAMDYAMAQEDDRIIALIKSKDEWSKSLASERDANAREVLQKKILDANKEIQVIQKEINKNPQLRQVKTDKGQVIEAKNTLKNPLVINAKGQTFDKVTKQAIEQAKKEGRDGVVINNVVDAISKDNVKPITTVLVFDKPKAINVQKKIVTPTKTVEKKSIIRKKAKVEVSTKPKRSIIKKDTKKKAEVTGFEALKQEARKYKSAEEFVNSQKKLYHGTTYDWGNEFKDRTTYLTPEKKFAEDIADQQVENIIEKFETETAPNGKSYYPTVKELYTKTGIKLFDPTNQKDLDWLKNNLPDNPTVTTYYGGVVNTTKDDILKSITKDKHSWTSYEGGVSDIIKKGGYDGLIAKEKGYPSVAIFEPNKSLLTKSQLTDIYNQANKKKTIAKPKPTNDTDMGFNPKNLENPFSPKAKAEMDKVIKQSDIAKKLSDKLNVPIRMGKYNRPALGIYKSRPKVVRLKSGGLQTIFHEVGHYLDDTIGFSKHLELNEAKALMAEYGYTYEGRPDKQLSEGFAEYLRFKMTGQQAKIDKFAPTFDRYFESKISTMPDIKSVIDEATAGFKRWAEQPSTAKVLSQISIGKQSQPLIKERAVTGIHDIYTAMLDDIHPLNEFSKLAKKRIGNVPAEKDPYILARNLRGWTGKADLFFNKGTFGKQFYKLDDKGKYVMDFKGKSYSEIMKPLDTPEKLDDFRVYIVSQRIVNDLEPRGIKTGIDIKDAKQALEELDKKHPNFEQIAKERREYKDQLMTYAEESGLIGKEGLKKMRELNKYHVPFYRVMEEAQLGFLGKRKIAGNVSNPIKKIKGSEREIIDPFESDIKDTLAIINASERNSIGIAMANLAKQDSELGRLFEEVSKPMQGIKVNAKEVMDKVTKQLGEDIKMPEELADIAVTIFRPTYARGDNMLNVNMGDKQLVFEVDPDLYQAIQGLNVEDAGLLMRLISLPAKVLRAGATLTPDFSLRNPLRDQFTAMVYSKYGFTPGIDLLRGMFQLFKRDNIYDLWKASGGDHASMVSLDRNYLQKSFKEIMASKKARTLEYLKNPLKPLQILSELGEAGTRLGEMRNALAKGASPIEAGLASREITLDFARIGAKSRAMNLITAFWNANLQGTDTMIRSFKNRPYQTLLKTLLGITLPSILLYMANKDDPRWKEIPTWQKNLFWIILTPDHIYRIPKPFELGLIFGSAPERLLEYIEEKDPKVFKELQQSILDGFTPGYLPTALLPIIENITNYSFFTGRPIVSRGQENLPAEAQAGTYTSEVAKIVGEALGYSPSKVDNLVQGYTGGLGKYSTQALDEILKGTGVRNAPVAPAKTLEDTPVLKAFMIRKPVGTGSESVNRVYEMYGETSKQLNMVKKLAKEGNVDEAKKYAKAHPEVVHAPLLSSVVDSYSQMNKAIDAIRKTDKLSAEEKRDKIEQINELQTEIAQKTLKKIKELDNE